MFLSLKSFIFIWCIRDLRHFKAEVLPFPKGTITFFCYKYFRRYRHLNKDQLQDMSHIMGFSKNDTSYSSCCEGILTWFLSKCYRLEIIKYHTNTKKMRYCSLISEECKCSKNPFFWIQLAMITLYFTFIFRLQGAIKSFLLLKIVLLEDGQISVW